MSIAAAPATSALLPKKTNNMKQRGLSDKKERDVDVVHYNLPTKLRNSSAADG
jgi:hypothetical protein